MDTPDINWRMLWNGGILLLRFDLIYTCTIVSQVIAHSRVSTHVPNFKG